MTAQEQLIDYAKQHNNGHILTDEEFVGKMVIEGCVISRTPSSKIVARAMRSGKTITVAETTITQTAEIVDGKIIFGTIEDTREVMRINL